MEEYSKSKSMILAILAVIVGLFMIAIAPFLIQTSVERVVEALIKISAEKPAYASGIQIFSIAFPVYRGVIFVGGVAMILMAGQIAKGKKWTYPVTMLITAFPSAGGMFMMMPYVSFIKGFPLPTVIAMVGLLFFWTSIFLRNTDKWMKWGQFLALTFAGMLTTHAFITGTGNLRMLMTRPEKPMFSGLGVWILSWSAPIQWLCVIMLFIAIYQLAAHKAMGWWLALIASFSLLIMDVSLQVIRLTMTTSTAWDYSYGLPVLIGLIFTLLFPKFKEKLLPDEGNSL
ncbi:MAG: hypothetical protein BGO78_02645 [Chloroflexi bacterium 44-23]|nr:MAG: hypothetical protein BGO78_02645 [Chloroflexi bacterium 44-23]